MFEKEIQIEAISLGR